MRYLGCLLLLLSFSMGCFAQDGEVVPKQNIPRNSFFKRRFSLALGAGGHFLESGNTAFSGTICPRVNILNRFSDISISMDVPAAMGFAVEADGLFAEIPVMFMMNYGNQATKGFYSNFGFALGTGYNTYYFSSYSASGFALSFCFRWWLFSTPCSARYLITFSNDRGASTLHGFGFGFPIGKWVRTNRQLNKISRFSDPFRHSR